MEKQSILLVEDDEMVRGSLEDALIAAGYDITTAESGEDALVRLYNDHFNDEEGKNSCDQVLKSSEQIATLADKINSFVATKEAVLQIERVRLHEILVMIREEFSSQLRTRQIRLLETGSFPEIMVDRISLVRLLRNLVDNGIKYGGDGLSEIEIGYAESEACHILSVRDNGAGLPKEEADRIFEPYRRGKSFATIAGTGLGLAIVKEVADQHRGEVWIEHGPRRGITFFVSIAKSLIPAQEDPSVVCQPV